MSYVGDGKVFSTCTTSYYIRYISLYIINESHSVNQSVKPQLK